MTEGEQQEKGTMGTEKWLTRLGVIFLIFKNNNKPKANSQIQNELRICQFNVHLNNRYPGSKVYLCSLKRDCDDFFLFYFTFYWIAFGKHLSAVLGYVYSCKVVYQMENLCQGSLGAGSQCLTHEVHVLLRD